MNNRTSVVYNHFVAVGSTSQGVPVYQHNQLETPYGFPTMQLSANGGKSVPHESSFNLSQISSIAPSQRLSLNLGGLTQKRERNDLEGPAQKPLVGASAPPVDPYSSACKGEILTTLLPPEVRERKSRRLEASSNQTNNSTTLSTAELESVKKVAESCDAEQKRIRDDVVELSESCTATQERAEKLNLEVHELKTKLRMAEEKMKEQQRLLDECREMKALVQSCVSEVRGIKSQVDRNEGRVATLETIGGGRQGGASSHALAADTVAPTGGGFAPSLAAPPAKVKTVSFAPPTPPPSSEGSTTNTVDEPKKTPFGFGSVGTQNGAEALPKPKGVSFDFNAVKPLASDSSNNNDTTAIVKPKTEASSLTSEKTEEAPKPSLSFGFGGSSVTTSFGAVAAAATSAATATPSPAVAAPTPFGATPAAAPPTVAPSPFGAPAAASATAAPSPFGAATNAVTTVAPPVAAAAPSPFGAAPPGSAPAAPSPFGATATSATSAPAAPSPFGAAATSAPAAPSPFGAAAAAPATTPFGAAATSNAQANGVPPTAPSPFGAAPAAASAPVAASPFGSAPSASPFGATATPFGGATSFGGTAAPVAAPSFGGPTAAGSAAAPPAASAAGGNPFSFGGGSTAAANPFSFGATNSAPAAPQGNPSPFGGQAVGSVGFAAGLAQPMAGAPLMGGGALGAHKQRPSGRGGLKRNY